MSEYDMVMKGIGKYEIRFLGTFPHVDGLILERVGLKEGDRLVILKMTGDTEAVVMVDPELHVTLGVRKV